MPQKKPLTGRTPASIILGLVGLACFAYAWIGGEDGRLPLMIAGLVSLTMILIIRQRAQNSNPDDPA